MCGIEIQLIINIIKDHFLGKAQKDVILEIYYLQYFICFLRES